MRFCTCLAIATVALGACTPEASDGEGDGDPAAELVDAGEAAFPDAGEGADAASPGPAGCSDPGGFPVPADARWEAVAGLRDEALRAALHERIKDHDYLTYNDARRAMFKPDGGIDVHDRMVECIYTGRKAAATTATTSGNMNIEHSWPQNEGAEVEPEKSDLHHLFPTDGEANLRRSSYPYGFSDCDRDGSCLWMEGGSELGVRRGGTERVFEVRPERRGDIARAHFYFSVRYQLPIPEPEEPALRCWNWTDPPDALERRRNDDIEAIQHNRNPFVDRPDLVERISNF